MTVQFRGNGAAFSEDRRYRWALWREWNDPLLQPGAFQREKAVVFLMLNPSDAGEARNDPTTSQCIAYATAWGYGRLILVNLFAFVSTDPRRLPLQPDPVGPECDTWIDAALNEAGLVIAAWGVPDLWSKRKDLAGRAAIVAEFVAADHDLLALCLTNGGHPHHPLRLSRGLKPIAWKPRRVPGELVVTHENSNP